MAGMSGAVVMSTMKARSYHVPGFDDQVDEAEMKDFCTALTTLHQEHVSKVRNGERRRRNDPYLADATPSLKPPRRDISGANPRLRAGTVDGRSLTPASAPAMIPPPVLRRPPHVPGPHAPVPRARLD